MFGKTNSLKISNMEAKTPKQIVKNFISSEEHGFEANEHGKLIYKSANGIHIINLEVFMEYLVEYANDQQCKAKEEELKKANSDIKEFCDTIIKLKQENFDLLVKLRGLERKNAELAKALDWLLSSTKKFISYKPVRDMDECISFSEKLLESHKANTPKEQPESREVIYRYEVSFSYDKEPQGRSVRNEHIRIFDAKNSDDLHKKIDTFIIERAKDSINRWYYSKVIGIRPI